MSGAVLQAKRRISVSTTPAHRSCLDRPHPYSASARHWYSFSIPQGQVAAFLGPNGAGKSTTMKILTGYLAPSSGVAHIAGLDVATHRIAAAERLGYLPENGPLYPDMTPLGLLKFFGRARGLTGAHLQQRIDAIIAAACSIDHARQVRSIYEQLGLEAREIYSEMDPEKQEKTLAELQEIGRAHV